MRVEVVGEAFSVEYEKLDTDRFRVNAFLQGQFPGATSPKGPAAQARAVFGGAPARQSVRRLIAGSTARLANPLLGNVLARLRVLRLGAKRASFAGESCCAETFSPQQPCAGVALLDHSPRAAGEGAMTVRMAAAMKGNTVVW